MRFRCVLWLRMDGYGMKWGVYWGDVVWFRDALRLGGDV